MHSPTMSNSFSIGEGLVTIRRIGRSQPIIANVLGIEANGDGEPCKIYLDRLVHRYADTGFMGDGEQRWVAEGAVSTILTRVSS